MEEIRIYKTRVEGDVKPFILGRISAAQELICKDHPKMSGRYAMNTIIPIAELDDEGNEIRVICTIFAVKTDQERYDEFTNLIMDWYSDIHIEFDISE